VRKTWSGDHLQLEMGLLGSAGRHQNKYLKLKYATFEGGFIHVFMGKKKFFF
jgi:hypothetical protein